MKLLLLSSLLFGISLADVPICENAQRACAAAAFEASTDVGEAPGSNCYGDVLTTPNPAWFLFTVDQPGDIVFDIRAELDVDYVLWGPFDSIEDANAACGNLCGNIISSDYGAAVPTNDRVNITGAQSGKVYILLITNYSNEPVSITAVVDIAASSGSFTCEGVDPDVVNVVSMKGTFTGIDESNFEPAKLAVMNVLCTGDKYANYREDLQQTMGLTCNDAVIELEPVSRRQLQSGERTVRISASVQDIEDAFELTNLINGANHEDTVAFSNGIIEEADLASQGIALTDFEPADVEGACPEEDYGCGDSCSGDPATCDELQSQVNTCASTCSQCMVDQYNDLLSCSVQAYDPANVVSMTVNFAGVDASNFEAVRDAILTVLAEDPEYANFRQDVEDAVGLTLSDVTVELGEPLANGERVVQISVPTGSAQDAADLSEIVNGGDRDSVLNEAATVVNKADLESQGVEVMDYTEAATPATTGSLTALSFGDPIIWPFLDDCYDLNVDGTYLATSHKTSFNHEVYLSIYNHYIRQITVLHKVTKDIMLSISNTGEVIDNWPWFFERVTKKCNSEKECDFFYQEFTFDAQELEFVVQIHPHAYDDPSLKEGETGVHLDVFLHPFNNFVPENYDGLYMKNPIPQESGTCSA